jgi:hypothetical protein
MANRRPVKAIATAALLLVVVTGCTGDGDEPRASRPSTLTSSSPTPMTTTAAPPQTASEAASVVASNVMRSYFTVLDELRQEPGRPVSALSKVATSIQLSAQETLLRRERSQGLHQFGDTKIGDLKVQSVNLDNSDPAAGEVPTVVIDVCWDVSHADLVDRTGKSVVKPNRTDIGWTRYTVANYHWDSNRARGWRVASGLDLKQAPCTPS